MGRGQASATAIPDIPLAVASKKPPVAKPAVLAENLHIAAVQRIVGKHRNNLRMPLRDGALLGSRRRY